MGFGPANANRVPEGEGRIVGPDARGGVVDAVDLSSPEDTEGDFGEPLARVAA